jgi:hypothetical protein
MLDPYASIASADPALKTEARRRAKTGEFFGQISFLSVIARRQ